MGVEAAVEGGSSGSSRQRAAAPTHAIGGSAKTCAVLVPRI